MSQLRTDVSRPRGRPQRLPVDPLSWTTAGFDAASRTAWLLAVTRLLTPRTASGGRREFIAAVGRHGVRLDTSRVSRVESGEQHPPPRVIAGYEAVTGVPTGSLQSISALLRRGAGDPPVADQGGSLSTVRLDEIFEAIDRQVATGHDWLCLARELEVADRVYLPPRTWADLSVQLIRELTRSTGAAYVRRHEAAVTLLHDPAGSRHLTMAIGRFVMHPHVQAVRPALSLLQEMTDQPAGDLVLRLMGDDNPLLRRSAAGVAGALSARQGFGAGRVETLERHARAELQRPDHSARRVDAIDLASRLSPDGYARVLGSISNPRLRAMVGRACSSLELVEKDTSRSTCEAIATFAEASSGRAAFDPDQMLRRLIREALFHVHHERRHLAAITLAASPYAAPVAQAALQAVREQDPMAATLCWSLLRRLGHVITREQVAEVALAEQRSALQADALTVMGVCCGAVPEPVGAFLEQTARAQAGTRLGHAALLALGMADHPRLHGLSARRGPWQNAAQWWTSVGPALQDPDS